MSKEKALAHLGNLWAQTKQVDTGSKRYLENVINEAFTYPTEEEVCEALEDLFWTKITYNKRRKLFATETKKCVQLIEGRIKTYYDYSPEVTIMLGRFYEAKVANNE